jgi:hypothetical protein
VSYRNHGVNASSASPGIVVTCQSRTTEVVVQQLGLEATPEITTLVRENHLVGQQSVLTPTQFAFTEEPYDTPTVVKTDGEKDMTRTGLRVLPIDNLMDVGC